MSGLGGYCYIVWAIWLRHCLNGKHDEYKLHWPRLTAMPVVIRTQRTTVEYTTDQANGHAKKEM